MKSKSLKLLHFFSTALLIASVAYIIVLSLIERGVEWWVIFTLSGPSLVIAFVMTSVYLFAFFKGASRKQEALEHPLTSDPFYLVMYDCAPFLGILTGIIGMIGITDPQEYLTGVCYTIFAVTFFVWIILDPALSIAEGLTSTSKSLRFNRIKVAKEKKQQEQIERDNLLSTVLAKIETNQKQWHDQLAQKPKALIDIAKSYRLTDRKGECLAVDIGVEAWQIGGQQCMKYLIELTKEELDNTQTNPLYVNHIAYWWNGIGNWNTALMKI